MQCRGSGEDVQPYDTTVACMKTAKSWQETDESGTAAAFKDQLEKILSVDIPQPHTGCNGGKALSSVHVCSCLTRDVTVCTT